MNPKIIINKLLNKKENSSSHTKTNPIVYEVNFIKIFDNDVLIGFHCKDNEEEKFLMFNIEITLSEKETKNFLTENGKHISEKRGIYIIVEKSYTHLIGLDMSGTGLEPKIHFRQETKSFMSQEDAFKILV